MKTGYSWTWVWYGILGAFIIFTITSYRAVNSAGWFPHRDTLPVSMPDSWLVGEHKTCWLDFGDTKASPAIGVALHCGSNAEPLRTMDVYFGFRVAKGSFVDCQRKEESITCKAQ